MAGRKIVMNGSRLFSVYNKKDVYPIVGIVGCALVFMAYKGYEHVRAPDVHFDKSRRTAGAWEGKFDIEEGERVAKHMEKFYRHKDQPLAELSIGEVLKPAFWRMRREVLADPDAALAHTTTAVAERANKLH